MHRWPQAASSGNRRSLISSPRCLVMKSVRQIWLLLVLCHLIPVLVVWRAGWMPGFLTMAAVHLVLLGFTLYPRSTWLSPAVRRFPATRNTVHLTIDDGPCGDTLAILELLSAHRAKALFFLIGERAAARPDLVRAILAAGHQLGNHTQTHPAKTFWAYPPAAQRREIMTCQKTLTNLPGHAPVWFRAPAGFRNPFLNPVLREGALTCMGWSARSFDTRPAPLPVLLDRLRPAFQPGSILLIHQGQVQSLTLLEALLAELTSHDLICDLPPENPIPAGA